MILLKNNHNDSYTLWVPVVDSEETSGDGREQGGAGSCLNWGPGAQRTTLGAQGMGILKGLTICRPTMDFVLEGTITKTPNVMRY
jgi:hypothetical protein